MALSDLAMATVAQAKAHLRIDSAAALHVSAEFVGVGDGADLTFDLDHTPIEGTLRLYVDNTLQVETTNFSISTATITFVAAPGLNKGITANYDYAAGDDTFESYDDLLLERLLAAATKRAEDYTGMAFVQGSVTEYHTGDGSDILRLYKAPVQSITSVVRQVSEAVATGDGATKIFTLNETPTASSLSLYVDGTIVTDPTHYDLTGSTITFGTAPTDGAKITGKYTHTLLPVNEYEEMLYINRLRCVDCVWEVDKIYKVVYTTGQAATREAAQVLFPDAVTAILLIVASLFENRTDEVKSIAEHEIGSVDYSMPSKAMKMLDLLRTDLI